MRQPRVRIVATGNEVVTPSVAKGVYEVYDANSYMLRGLACSILRAYQFNGHAHQAALALGAEGEIRIKATQTGRMTHLSMSHPRHCSLTTCGDGQ